MGKMSPGMRMLVMSKVGDDVRRMGDEPEMRRRRDAMGRFV